MTTAAIKQTSAPIDGDHSYLQGTMTLLAAYLNNSLSTLKVLDATNKNQVSLAGLLQNVGTSESTEIDRLSGDAEHGDTQAWYKDGFDPSDPRAPGLQWLLANKGQFGDDATVMIESMQSHISDVQLDYTNETSSTQQKVDVNKDTGQDIESEVNSLLQSMVSGLVSIIQTGNSARV